MSSGAEYSAIETEKLAEFRKRVSDILDTEERQDDTFLIRWLRARSLDLNKAEVMLRAAMKWRKDNDMDTLLEREEGNLPPELLELAPLAYCGVSKDGCLTFIVPFGRHDSVTALEKYGVETMKKFNMILMERFSRRLRIESKRLGRKVTQIVEIGDCEGYSYRQLTSRGGRELMTFMTHLMDNYYPELLRYMLVVNTPKVFVMLYNMLKPITPKETLAKIDIYAGDPEKWKAVVREKFPLDRIPPHWGGTLEGVDEYCSGHEIWIQGPKDLRPLMRGLAEADADFHKTNINARDKFTKDVEVKEKGTILEWKFKTEANDIGFQLSYSNETKSEDVDIVAPARVDASICVQEGNHVCQTPGKYSFIFYNNFSMLKGKTLLYQIEVIDKQEQKEIFEECSEY